MDVALTGWINGLSGVSPFLDALMVAITQFGVPLMIIFVALQWWSANDRMHVRHAALCAGLSFLLSLAINQLILLFVHRLRPYDAGITHLLVAKSVDWSFPSDHATASISIVAAFFLQRLPRRTLVLFGVAVLVCWSRIYVGTHYVSDILGGGVTGIVAALIVRYAYKEGSRLDRFASGIL